MARANSDIELARGSPQYMPLALDQSSNMVVLITNHGPDPVDAVTLEIGTYAPYPPWTYPMQMDAQPGCGTLMPVRYFSIEYAFDAGPISAGQTIRCVLRVTRSDTSVSSTPIDISVSDSLAGPNAAGNWVEFFVGTFTDLSLNSRQTAFSIDANGIAHSTLRLRVRNSGPADVGPFHTGACTDSFFPPFYIESEFPGGCGPDVGEFCFDSGFGFQFPALAAGQAHSCDLHLTSIDAYTGPLYFIGWFSIDDYQLPDPLTNGTLLDINQNDNVAYLFQAAPQPQPAPAPVGSRAEILLAFALAVLAAIQLHAARTGQRRGCL